MVGVPNEDWGGEEVKAVVELKPGWKPTPEIARGTCLELRQGQASGFQRPRTIDSRRCPALQRRRRQGGASRCAHLAGRAARGAFSSPSNWLEKGRLGSALEEIRLWGSTGRRLRRSSGFPL